MPPRASSRRVVLVVMCVGYFLVLLDVTIVNVALPSIRSGLHAGVSGLQWVVDGYALALASLMLASGTTGDLHGHKRIVLSGLVIFGAGSLCCGMAPGTGALIAARAVQGVGAALLLPGTLAVITHAFPDRAEQARAIGAWAAIGSLALPAGPLVGGLLVDGLGWRSVFLLNVPIVVVALGVAGRVVRESREPPGRRLDLAGAGLGALTLGAVLFGVIQAGRSGLGSAPALVALGAALVLVGALVAVERSQPDPMLPLALLRRPAFFLTPAVVSAAVGAVPAARAGLASGVNNTARQAGGAIGIAAFGALAGSPARQAAFLAGMHTAALTGAGLYVAAAALGGRLIPSATAPARRPQPGAARAGR